MRAPGFLMHLLVIVLASLGASAYAMKIIGPVAWGWSSMKKMTFSANSPCRCFRFAALAEPRRVASKIAALAHPIRLQKSSNSLQKYMCNNERNPG